MKRGRKPTHKLVKCGICGEPSYIYKKSNTHGLYYYWVHQNYNTVPRSHYISPVNPYQSLTQEQKIQHNRENQKIWLSDPINHQKKLEYLRQYRKLNRERLNKYNLEYYHKTK